MSERERKWVICLDCHREMPHAARGLCSRCSRWRSRHPGEELSPFVMIAEYEHFCGFMDPPMALRRVLAAYGVKPTAENLNTYKRLISRDAFSRDVARSSGA